MQILNCLQRSDEWYAARRGIPTASAFAKIITKDGKPRKGVTVERYIASLVQEVVTGEDADTCSTWAMQRGQLLEPHARAWYEIVTGNKVKTVGFVYGDDSKGYGCSPDGLVYDGDSIAGVVEIKCPLSITHPLIYGLDDDYVIQAQGEMWVCGATWCDLVIYTEGQEEKPLGTVFKILRDEKMHAAFAAHIPALADAVIKMASDVMESLCKFPRVGIDAIAEHLGPEWARAVVNNGEVEIGGAE